MQKFPHIGALYQALDYVKQYPDRVPHGTRAVYTGTIKLHGTNAGVCLMHDRIIPQSRNRVLSLENDHCGFAAFALGETQQKVFRNIEQRLRAHKTVYLPDPPPPITLFGEWCGPGIQKGVGLSKLPERQFVIFAAAEQFAPDGLYFYPSLSYTEFPSAAAAASIYSIHDAPSWVIEIDLTAPEDAVLEQIEKATLEVEESCPWASRFGVEGIGEGLVWTPEGPDYQDTNLWFKSKGRKHRAASPREKKIASMGPEVVKSVADFCNLMVTEARLQQGIDYLTEMSLPLSPASTGKFLNWIREDVKREGALELEANGLTFDAVNKEVCHKAAQWYLARVGGR